MSTSNLINLNVDTLFEKHSVQEIDSVSKKIRTIVEDKREELRTMVGERYRDLLKAADTIASMQSSAATLIEQLKMVQANCRNLNEQQLIGFKTMDNSSDAVLPKRSTNKQLNNYYSTMVQIKLLISLPELIWTHIDKEQFYAATELYIFSQHISTGLQLDAKNTLMQQLPVARKQWELLRTFHTTIKQAILNVLERETLSVDMTVDCVLSLLLLDKCNLNQVVHTFLRLRCSAYINCISSKTDDETEGRRRVKDRILASLRILISTVELTDKCLLSKGLLYERVAECMQLTTPVSIARMDSSDRQLTHLLPDVIANFRPKFETLTPVPDDMCAALEKWLTDTLQISNIQLKQLFVLVTNMQSIQEIKNTALNYRRQYSFTHIIEFLNLKQTLDFYETRYVPLINERIRDIINDSWSAAMQQTISCVQHIITENSASTNVCQMWLDQNSDLPYSLADALSEDLKIKKLLNKIKGYDATIISVCSVFDEQLAAIVAELNVLLQEQTTRVEDKLMLIEFLRDTAQLQMTQFISQLKSMDLSERGALLFVLRTCVALIELCPHLKICFCQQSSWRQWIGSAPTNNAEHWQRLCALYETELLQLWLQLLDGILLEQPISGTGPKEGVTNKLALEDFVNWQTIKLEQKDEQDNTVQSTIRIPSHPRISLQTYLFRLIRTLNKAVPQTLPRKVLQAFNDKLLTQILLHYQGLVAAESTKTRQNVALQLYFDLKFLQSIFNITRDERTLYEQFTTMQKNLRDYIDPFDFELFAEHIVTNVKYAVTRLSGQFGVLLTPNASQTQSIAAATLLAHESDPNLLCLSSSGATSLWFPLLPIVSSNPVDSDVERRVHSVETEKMTPTRKVGTNEAAATTRKNDSNKSKSSGAASFFGMSQEWFR